MRRLAIAASILALTTSSIIAASISPAAAAGQPLWDMTGNYTIQYFLNGSEYDHTDTFAVSDAAMVDPEAFTGTGTYVGWPGVNEDVTGTLTGSDLAFTVVYRPTSPNPGYTVNAVGTVASDGSLSGTATGPGQSFTWTAVGKARPFGYTTAADCGTGSFVDAKGAVTSVPTVAGHPYDVTVSGTYYAGGAGLFDIRSDAEYSQDRVQFATGAGWTPLVHNYELTDTGLLDLWVNGASVDWGPYAPTHVYKATFVAPSASTEFAFNISDPPMASNNTGGLCVSLVDRYTAGSWVQYPTGGATIYEAQVQQPINTANTSNWSSKSKGGIPVMFKLREATGPAVFQSIYSDNGDPLFPPWTGEGPCGFGTAAVNLNDCAYVAFTPDGPLTFSDVSQLTATYQFVEGDCYGGALRWSVDLDTDGDGASNGSLWLNYGNVGAFNTCEGAYDQSAVNMMSLTDGRWDSTVGGWSYGNTLAQIRSLYDGATVMGVSLVLDAGWGANGNQVLSAGTTATVNGNTYTWDEGGSAMADTCDLPPATIQVDKGDPVSDGAVNEQPVQAALVDSGNAFRVVDCKYQYILSIPYLLGAGTYQVLIEIGGIPVPTPGSPGGTVKFDLK